MLKKSKQKEILEKLNDVGVRRDHNLVETFREFQELLQASEPEMTESESSRTVEKDQALYEAVSNYATVRGGDSPNPQWVSDASEALDKELEEMRMFIEHSIETADG